MRVLAGIALLVSMVPAMAGASVLFTQDFSSSSTVADYTNNATPVTNRFNTISAAAPDAFSITGGALTLTKGGVAKTSTIGRATPLAAAPLTLLSLQCDIGFAFTGQTAGTSLGFFELGKGDGTLSWGTSGFQVDSTGSNNVWRITGGGGGFTGVKTVKLFANDTGSNAWYIAPDGSKRTITNTYVDVWVGTTLAKSSIASGINTANDINGFRYVSPAVSAINSGTLTFDKFIVEQIPEPATIGLISFATAGLLLFRRFSLRK